jgi:uncharacterized protein with HEPN domain
MRDDRERILDILEAIEKVEKYSSKGRDEFESNELIQIWIIHHIQIIGEAASKISDDLRKSHPEIPWPQIIAMRNILVHDYYRADLDEVWIAVESGLPDLKEKVKRIIERLKKES